MEILANMKTAYKRDQVAFSQGEVAINKINFLEELPGKLTNVHFESIRST